MLKQLYRILVSCACLLFGCSLANAYDYPFTDRYVTTVVGTPVEYAEVLPTDMPTRTDTIKMFPERKIPGVVWNMDALYYSYNRQNGPALLIFLVAGTGASFKSAKMQHM